MKFALSNTIRQYGGVWTPANLSGLQAWFQNDTDILESDTTRAENGDNVTQWSDQSGNNNHLTAPDNYFTFNEASGGVESGDAENDKLHLTSQLNFSGQFSMYVRIKFSTFSTGATDLFFYDKDTSSQDFFRIQSTSEIRGKIDNSAKIGFGTTIETGTYYNIGVERDGTNRVTVYLNGSGLTQITTTGYEAGVVSGTLDIDAIGGSLDGIIKEVVITNTALSSSDRSNLQAYLNNI
ncbi:MAG: hypothetical protein GOVbin2669_6 [Prokaryotic dsDNA virus sp.]|nr:MAG: hypothetical protein GOVbin2669_6 [Prokaryotic dsDNA virus sp.]|tara:strand:+ start:1547 stop:2257 length:711 start_codon:yes stop_codon:yes gene_type:complete